MSTNLSTERIDNRGFVAGTLVHTASGLVPIEAIKAGDRVLSRQDAGSVPELKTVLRSVEVAAQELQLLSYAFSGEAMAEHLVVSMDQEIWLAASGWTRVDRIDGAPDVDLCTPGEAYIVQALPIVQTDDPSIGFACRHGWEIGNTVDFGGAQVTVSDGDTFIESAFDSLGYFERPLFALQVEGLHSYFVGRAGLWVHDGSRAC